MSLKYYSFSFTSGQIEQFNQLLTFRSKKILRNYLLHEYTLPDSPKELQRESNVKIHYFWLNEEEILKIDYLIEQAKNQGYSISRSAVMRDVIRNLILRYKDNPIKHKELMRQRFKIPEGTKIRIEKLIKEGALTFELSNFIMDGYVPSNNFPSIRNQKQEDLNFKTNIEVFEKLDEIANDYGFKKGGRAIIFRDALAQFETLIADNSPKKTILEQQLKKIIEDYKGIEEPSVIKEKVSEYLKD